MEHRKIVLGVMVMSLTLMACGGDSGNNSAESEGDSSSSMPFSSSSQRLSSSSAVQSSSSFSSSVGVSSSSLLVVSSSSVTLQLSSATPLSSSAIASSSSSTEDGTLTYEGQTYKTVTIGTQTWMAENLNYGDSVQSPNLKGSSWCYNNSVDSCAKYGRLYQWASAMDINPIYTDSLWEGSDVNHQGICPHGWHLPNNDEWSVLYDYVEMNNGSEGVGMSLKSTSGWYSEGNGMDCFGFSALPTGNHGVSQFNDVSKFATFWSATENKSNGAGSWSLRYAKDGFYDLSSNGKFAGFSVRCLKNAK